MKREEDGITAGVKEREKKDNREERKREKEQGTFKDKRIQGEEVLQNKHEVITVVAVTLYCLYRCLNVSVFTPSSESVFSSVNYVHVHV